MINMWRELLMAACALSVNLAPFQAAGGGTFGSPVPGNAASPRQGGYEGPSCIFHDMNASVGLDEAGNSMDVRVRISMDTGKNTSSVLLGLNAAMNIAGIAEDGLGALAFRWVSWSWVNISLGRSLPPRTALNITVNYSGRVQNSPDGGNSFWDYIGQEGSWVRPYANYFPCDERYGRTTYRLSVTLPQDKAVAAAGMLVGKYADISNGTVTYIWDSAQAVRGISFAAGRLNLTEVSQGQNAYHVFFRQEHGASAQLYTSELDRIRGFYTSLLGPPGFRNMTVVELPDKFAALGQTVPSMIWLASRNFVGPFPYRLLAHEMGHQWWGVDVEGIELFDNWMQEGFSGYYEALYEMAVYGSRGYLDYCKTQYINQFVQSSLPEPTLIGNDYDLATSKGPWVLHMLRFLAGGANFQKTLFDFHRNFTGRHAVPADFIAETISSTGLELEGFFDFWLNTSGRLDYALTNPVIYKGDGANDRLRISAECRGRVIGLPADMGFYDGAGQRIAFLPRAYNASAPNATLDCYIDYSVDTVKLDPDGWLLDAYQSNNEAPTRIARLDFSIDGLALVPEEPMENQTCILKVNLSSASSEGPNTVGTQLLVDGLPAGNGSTDLSATDRKSTGFEMTLAAGPHVLSVQLDPGGEHYETDRTDNIASLNVTVRVAPTPRPDLLVLAGNIGYSPPWAVEGEAVQLSALVRNVGLMAAQNFTVMFLIDSNDVYAGISGRLSLPPGGSVLATVPWNSLPGRHEVTVRSELPSGEDPDLSNNEASGIIYVNIRPVALLSASAYELGSGDWVELSGISSMDDTNVAYYLFDPGDGESTGWLREPDTVHRYMSRGIYKARLKVQDDTGAESDWSAPVTIRVRDEPPVAALSVVPRTGYVSTRFSLWSLSHDEDGNVTEHVWTFGDGKGARGDRVDHTFATHGDFRVTLTVLDDAGLTAETSMILRVLDLPPLPAISLNRSSALVGEHIVFGAGGSSDPDDPPSALTFIWDFGDGQRASGPSASYAFRRPGAYRVVLTVSDGNLSAERSVIVTVRLAVPPPQVQGPGWQSWAVLGALLAAMALLVISMMIPDIRRSESEEEE
jgi:PKD repeat protein